MSKKRHWILRHLFYLRKEAKNINFASGTTRRRNDLIALVTAINRSCRDTLWNHNFYLSLSDNGVTGKIILTPKYLFIKNDGKIIFEFPSFHNTHKMIFVFFETPAGQKVAEKLRQSIQNQTMGFSISLIFKQGRKLIPLDPA